MHTTSRFRIAAKEYIVIHNGDWSGEAEIHCEGMYQGGTMLLAKLPGRLLRSIGRRATIDELIGVLEQLDNGDG